MATHYVRHHGPRRALNTLIELVACWLTAWIEFWQRTEPTDPAHESGATETFAVDLHDWNTHSDTARFRQLYSATVISGDPELTDTMVDGWSLCGNLYDQNGGAA